jgi:RES domain-containing protein
LRTQHTLDEKFLDVAIRQAEAQVPADRDDDDLGWEPKADEGGPQDWSGTRRRVLMAPVSLLEGVTANATLPFRHL